MATFNFSFSDLALMILKLIFAQLCTINGLKLGGALEEFSITAQFLGLKNAKINSLKKMRVLSAVFFELKYR